jgi:hypothetical protein
MEKRRKGRNAGEVRSAEWTTAKYIERGRYRDLVASEQDG